MEDSSKKSLMIGVIVVCMAVAGIITFTRKSDSTSPRVSMSGKKTLVKCSNPDCGAEYEMDEQEYYDEISERIDRTKFVTQPLVCKECGKESIYKALKCSKCGAVFFYASSDDYADRCSECGYSPTDDRVQKHRAKQPGAR